MPDDTQDVNRHTKEEMTILYPHLAYYFDLFDEEDTVTFPPPDERP